MSSGQPYVVSDAERQILEMLRKWGGGDDDYYRRMVIEYRDGTCTILFTAATGGGSNNVRGRGATVEEALVNLLVNMDRATGLP
jgi:hypothetical protein